MGHRRRAREHALQILFQLDLIEASPREAFDEFWKGQRAAAETRAFAEHLVDGVHARRAEMDRLIAEAAQNWRIERMAVVDRNVLRIAVFELQDGETPPAVIIDEAIEVAKKFGSEDSGSFINGILDAVRKRVEGRRAEPGGSA